ncbi:DUF4190 domain-containing protein [Corynebacterium urinipleomorphum]|uniref:DUF4190 domain-containing protein n=1 Tax=Corynebacterium urinipleomorphum TaxID=1852380 RepID=UPI000B358B4C|nr:DUF4190 domain-containing protein [Corynebacterium urinipleomorphum]
MVHPNPFGAGYPRSPRDPLNEPYGGYSHERAGQFDGYGQPFDQGPVDAYGRYNPHGPNSYLPAGGPSPTAGEPMRANGYATASLILGILTALTSWWFIISGSIAAIGGIVLGVIGIGQNRRGLRRGGLVQGTIGIVLNGCALVSAIVFAAILISMTGDPGAPAYDGGAPSDPGGVNESILERSHDRYTENV